MFHLFVSRGLFTCVDVLRFCHQITVQGKCHHGRKSDIEPERTGKVNGTQSGRERRDERKGSRGGTRDIDTASQEADSGVPRERSRRVSSW